MKITVGAVALTLLLPTDAFVAPVCPARSTSIAPTTTTAHVHHSCSLRMAAADSEEQPFPQSLAYKGAQLGVAVAFLGLADAGFSGDWVAQGFITPETEAVCREVFKVVAGIHVISAGASATIASQNGGSVINAVLGGLLTGALDVGRSATFKGTQEDASSSSSSEVCVEDALSMELKSEDLKVRSGPTGKMLTTVIVAKKGSEKRMRGALVQLVETVKAEEQNLVYTITVNQNPQDPTEFMMVERFPNERAMSMHRGGAAYAEFVKVAEGALAQPMGLHLINERYGKLAEGVIPFGPGGEGGRDDAIYSSPANVQGSSFTAKEQSTESREALEAEVKEALIRK